MKTEEELVIDYLKSKKLENILPQIQEYVDLLLDWNQKINLIGKSTENQIWERHILDSIQLLDFMENKELSFADFGSGAGLPGIVLSISGIKNITLLEKSFRKCEFLEEAKKISKNKINIINKNIKDINDLKFDIIVSRALASLDKLLELVKPFLKKDSKCIFLKGENLDNEIEIAKKSYNFEYSTKKSITSPTGKVIIISKILN